jgi:hypothetical protein
MSTPSNRMLRFRMLSATTSAKKKRVVQSAMRFVENNTEPFISALTPSVRTTWAPKRVEAIVVASTPPELRISCKHST